ncbi:MAG: Lrp/AsnC family transcriptional regulator [SAR202 cluster bacterium]|nr:Lrp/AsnC family transcriptional regulator [SAR202 cluster bacterium]
MDELDTKIIEMLQVDGRASNAGIARKVGVSEGTVRRRLKRLVQDEFIQVVALPNPVKLGYHSEALIGLQVDPNKIDEVAEALSELREVSWVAITAGRYDVFAWATLPSSEALGVFLKTQVGTIKGVQRSETFINLSNKKRGYGVAV